MTMTWENINKSIYFKENIVKIYMYVHKKCEGNVILYISTLVSRLFCLNKKSYVLYRQWRGSARVRLSVHYEFER